MDISVGENHPEIFCHHPPKGDQVERYSDVRFAASRMAATISNRCPNSAERTLALRKVQEAMMWANAAIAINE